MKEREEANNWRKRKKEDWDTKIKREKNKNNLEREG